MSEAVRQPRRWLFLLPIVAGLIILVMVVRNQKPLPMAELSEKATPVQVYTVKKAPLAPELIAYGRAQPKRSWQALSEVEGRLIYRHPELELGSYLPANTLLARIDPLQYELKLAQARADLESVMSELASLEMERDNTRLSLNVEKRQLKLSEEESKRKQSLLKRKLIAESSFDQEQRNLLAQRQKVLDLESRLRVIPLDKEVLDAKLRVQQARVKDAERELSKTEIRLPFSARIVEIDAELDQVISRQQSLVTAHGLEAMEIESRVSIEDMRELITTLPADTVVDLGQADPGRLLPRTRVKLNTTRQPIFWQGQVTRISGRVDQNTGTLGVIVEVEQDLSHLRPRHQTPLVDGMFVEIQSFGIANEVLAIPSQALHGSQVYLVDENQRLQKREVEPMFSSGGWTAIRTGLSEGEQVVVNDLIPVIEGILLAPEALELRLPTQQPSANEPENELSQPDLSGEAS